MIRNKKVPNWFYILNIIIAFAFVLLLMVCVAARGWPAFFGGIGIILPLIYFGFLFISSIYFLAKKYEKSILVVPISVALFLIILPLGYPEYWNIIPYIIWALFILGFSLYQIWRED